MFRLAGTQEAFRGGVAIGDQVVDLAALAAAGLLDGAAQQAALAAAQPALNDFFALGPAAWRALRHALFAALNADAAATTADAMRACLRPQSAAEFTLPARIGDYTDFYTSIDHAEHRRACSSPTIRSRRTSSGSRSPTTDGRRRWASAASSSTGRWGR